VIQINLIQLGLTQVHNFYGGRVINISFPVFYLVQSCSSTNDPVVEQLTWWPSDLNESTTGSVFKTMLLTTIMFITISGLRSTMEKQVDW